MAGRHKKKTPNVKQSMNQLVETATRLYREPYDDRSGKRSTLLPSVRQVADEMGSSIWRVRKLLITAGYYSTTGGSGFVGMEIVNQLHSKGDFNFYCSNCGTRIRIILENLNT